MAFDPQTRTLFVVANPGAYKSNDGDWYPMVHGWHIKE